MSPVPLQSDDSSRPRWLAIEETRFRAANWLGVALIGLQAIILGYLSDARLFPAIVIGLALVIGTTRYRLRLDRLVLQLGCAAIVIGFILNSLVAPVPFPDESPLFRTPWAHTVASCLLCLQLVALAVYRESGHPPVWLAGLGAITLPFAANVQIAHSTHRPLVFWIISFIAVAALYCSYARRSIKTDVRPRQRMRLTLLMFALVGAMSLGGGSAVAVLRYERNIEWLLRDFLGQRVGAVRIGFSPNGRLNDVLAWKTLDADRITMRVFSDHEPGYLRGKAFDEYHLPEWDHSWKSWSASGKMQPLLPVDSVRGLPQDPPAGRELFELNTAAHGPWETVEVWPETRLGEYLFTPLDAGYLVIDSPYVMRDDLGNLMCEDVDESRPYTCFAAADPQQSVLSVESREQLTHVDRDLDPYLFELSETLFADCHTAREKMNRVQSWFRNNFGYQLGIRIPRRADPIAYFLKEKKPAHCEFFATGTAILLRIADVPCRYVTGFVAAEENAVGGYWIARNKDGHAWVEAYDDASRSWVIVESTPAAGIPASRETAVSDQITDSVGQRWTMMLAMIRSIGIGGILRQAAEAIWSIPALIVLLLLAGGLLLWRNPSLPVMPFQRSDRRLKDLHAVLRKLDRQAQRHGLHRRDNETLLQFADRIRRSETDLQWRNDLAECYDRYAEVRFRKHTNGESLSAQQSN